MEVYLLRHAIAVDRGTPEYEGRDDERPLTDEGIKKTKDAARGLKRSGLVFDRIWTSPILRARHTAEIVAKKLGLKKVMEQTNDLGDGFSCDAVVALLQRAGADEKVLLVGHEPDFSVLAGHLLNGRGGMNINFKKGGMIRLDFEGDVTPGAATLVYMLEPKHLKNLK